MKRYPSLCKASGLPVTNEPSSTPPPVPGRAAVLAAIDGVIDPRSGKGLVAAGMVQGLALGPGRAGFMMEVAANDAHLYAQVRDAAEPARPSGALKPDHVGLVIAVASGKGGVGKSTVAVNLACAFARLGYRAGLMDADIYGPSAPQMLGIDEEPQADDDKKLKPLEAWGIKVMSIGFLVDAAAPMIWRGPMASSAVNQFLNDVSWGSAAEPLDILVVDMPPGTGDIQLTLVQRVALAGAVLVSTPQEV